MFLSAGKLAVGGVDGFLRILLRKKILFLRKKTYQAHLIAPSRLFLYIYIND